MVEKISIAIALEGGKEVEQQLADIGTAGQKAFGDISKSAEQVGGFKNLKPEDISAKLEEMGVTGVDAINKIQQAVKSASRFESIVQGVAAVENGFLAVAKAAAIVGAAVVAAGVALSRYTSEAAKVNEQLRPLADISGKSIESISAMQIAFAQGGTSAQQFAKEFTDLQVKVAQASATMDEDVKQSSLRVAEAQNNLFKSYQATADAVASIAEAEDRASEGRTRRALERNQEGMTSERAQLSLAQAQLKLQEQISGKKDPAQEKRLADAAALLQVREAEQRIQALAEERALREAQRRRDAAQEEERITKARQAAIDAQLEQEKRAQQLRVAQANDLGKIIDLYGQLAQGEKVAFDPLTTAATKTQALYAALAKATEGGQSLDEALADIVKNASALERFQIAKALGLDPKTLNTLAEGADTLRANKEAVETLGLALTQVDSTNLKAFTDSWSKLGATAVAALEKVGAALAPVGTAIAQTLEKVIEAFVGMSDPLENTKREFAAIADAATTAWGYVVEAINGASQAIGDFVSALSNIGWDVISAGIDWWNSLSDAITSTIEKLKEFLGLQPQQQGAFSEAGGIQAGGAAAGGLIRGSGTGTSDSNLAWVSRGEHIMPARAVAQPGMLAFLEALRRSGGNLSRVLDGMGRFALGGLVPRSALAYAAGGLVGGMSNVSIHFPGLPAIGGLRASTEVVGELQRAAALAQVRSGGRKPSRYS